ncbi:MAG: hypothetical protein R3359_13240, partial [Marinirhabdus sp.]|nr:hypothetical protein [Marinirhabdus sp.]
LPIGLGGTLTNPNISVDTKAAVSTLTQKLIEKQKENIKDQGIEVITGILGGSNKPNDSTSTSGQDKPSTTDVVKDIFGGLFGKKKDTVNN